MTLHRPTDLIGFQPPTVFLDGNLRAGFRRELHQLAQVVGLRQVQLGIAAARQAFRQQNIAVAHADQTADLHADRFPQATHFAVTPFGQGNVIPLVNPFAAGEFDGFKRCRTIF